MRPNHTKVRLQAGETALGCFLRYPDATLVEVVGYQPWDFVVFDGEHGTLEPAACEHMVRAAELRNVTSIVRVPTNQAPAILRLLDTGAQGAQVPWINTAAEAEAAVQAIKYHPRGVRGLAGVRASDYGLAGTLAEYTDRANRETLVVLQVETVTAVTEIEQIVTVPDVDVIFIGPTDLSHSLGHPGQPQHPDVQAAMQRVIDAVLARPGLALGTMVTSVTAAREWRTRGARYLTIHLDALAGPAMRAYLDAVRA